jgi:hypothetical protein
MNEINEELIEKARAALQALSIHDDSEIPDLPELPELPTREGETVAIFVARRDQEEEPTSK